MISERKDGGEKKMKKRIKKSTMVKKKNIKVVVGKNTCSTSGSYK